MPVKRFALLPHSIVVLLLAAVLLLVAACAPGAAQSPTEVPLPTIFPSPTPEGRGLLEAQRVAAEFLDAWARFDYAAMYARITFATQEALPQQQFIALYQDVHDEMTLDVLLWQANTIWDDGVNAGVLFNYRVTFQTRLVGEFSDENRDLRLVLDSRAGTWRVAWSPGDIFAEMANGGQLRLERTIPARANIYDRTGEVVLASQEGRYVTVSVVKQNMPQPENCPLLLADVTLRPLETIQRLLDNAGADWVVEIGVMEAQTYEARQSELEQVCAARFSAYPVRRYPDGTLMPHILGTVGYPDESEIQTVVDAGFNQDSILGQSGIELSWDDTLRGQVGARLVLAVPGGTQVRELARTSPQPGQSVWLTIDADLQRYTERVLVDEYASGRISEQSDGAAVVLLEINTGAVLTMVSYPTYDNNAFTPFPLVGRQAAQQIIQEIGEDERNPLLNRATQGAYPTGSTMKVITGTAVLDSGVWSINQRFNSTGTWNRDIPRTDWLAGGHGSLTVRGAIAHSCNSCFYEAGYQMDLVDPFILPGYMRRMGLGAATGLLDLPEDPGLIPDPDWVAENRPIPWSFSDSVNIAIGQGEVRATPLQMARVAAVIGSGGTHYRPQLVAQVGILGEAPTYLMEPEVTSLISIDPAVLAEVRGGMCDVTTEAYGTAQFIFRYSPLQEFGVCGKTGTAQATGEGALPHAWFIAYAPRENPTVAIAVMVENTGDGSAFAAPITCRVLEYYFFGEPRSQCNGAPG